MLSFSRLAMVSAVLVCASSASAAEPLTIAGSLVGNGADLVMVGNDNVLTILQEAPLGADAFNSVRVRLTGDRNGGAAGRSFGGAALATGLLPGHLTQSGLGNLMDISVDGSDNLFAASQTGSANQLAASIVGHGNQSAVRQTGNGNIANFSQVGNGNMVSITQTSW